MAKLAFLTEVRDCAAYLPQAIESILNQTFQDFDYYIMDDGSTDGTREIIAAYAQRDKRILPEYREGDMHGNFNRALKRIYESGAEYFSLLDADDWYEPEFAETMVAMLEETGADLAEAKFTAHYENGAGEDALPDFGNAVVTLKEFAENFSYFSFFDSMTQWWCKVYRVPLLQKLDLFTGAGWDTEFVLRYRAGCSAFAVCDIALHHYRIRETSDCHKRLTAFDGARVAQALAAQHQAREEMLDAAGCQNPQSRLMAAYQDVNGVKSNMMRLYVSPVPDETAGRELLHLLRLPFLAEAYEAVTRSFRETGALFSTPPEEGRKAMASIRSYYSFYLRLTYLRAGRGNEDFLFQWLCRVCPELADFFEAEDLPVLMAQSEAAAAVLEQRYRQALVALCAVKPTDENGVLRAFACARTHSGQPFLRRYLEAVDGRISPRKRAYLNLQING